MKNKLIYTGLVLGLLFSIFTACEDDIDPVIEKLDLSRVFTPLDLKVQIRNKNIAEINWEVKDDADSYVVEISEDSLVFATIIETRDIDPDSVPCSITLEWENRYSARVKGVSNSIEDSKWAQIVFKTDAENIFNTLTDDNIGKSQVTLSWPAGSEVSHFIISTSGADDVRRDITNEEAEAGVATITGLAYDTEYEITMYNEPGIKQRGYVKFTTLPEGKTITSDMDLNEAINTTYTSEDVFLLEGGEYTAYTGTLTLNRKVTIKGLSSDDKPKLYIQFVIGAEASDISLSNLEMNGYYNGSYLDHAVQFDADGGSLGDVTISGCYIHDYNKSFVSGSGGAFSVSSLTVDDCIVTDVYGNGGDFIDFRTSFAENISVTNSTFSNCSTVSQRQFFRFDGESKKNLYDDGTNTPTISITNCTLYNVMNGTSETRLFYVRWQKTDEVLISKNNLFVEMGSSLYSRDSDTNQPTFGGNNYYNAASYYDSSKRVYDTGSYTTLDPGFADAANGDFTISNQTLIDNGIGDPRWRSNQ